MKRCKDCWYYGTAKRNSECVHLRVGENAEDNGDGNYLAYPYNEGGGFFTWLKLRLCQLVS